MMKIKKKKKKQKKKNLKLVKISIIYTFNKLILIFSKFKIEVIEDPNELGAKLIKAELLIFNNYNKSG